MSPSLFSANDKQVGQWRLSKDVLGSGTTSTVVFATHAKLPTLRAAVKMISRQGLLIKAGGDPTALHLADAVIHREVLLMKLAAHERVVRLYDFFGIGDTANIVMEYAPHQTLFDMFRSVPSYLPTPLVTHIFSQFVEGLAHLHALHIVHRDLKLENIFVFGSDVKTLVHGNYPENFSAVNIKIGDFGLAHVDDPQKLSNVFHGSPHYQAPEIWARVPHRALPTDIWSAGVILYALQSRHLPFDLPALEVCATAFSSQHKHGAYATPTTPLCQGPDIYMAYDVPESLPLPTDRLLRRLFAIDPMARPTARDILDDAFFDGLLLPADNHTSYDASPCALNPRMPLHDLATLCVPPGRHVPPETFVGSTLEGVVQERLVSREGGEREKMWARRLGAFAEYQAAWEAAMEAKVWEKERKDWARTLGRKTRAAEVLGQKETHLAVPGPKLTASLSLRTLRLKTVSKLHHDVPPHRPLHAPHASSSSSSVAEALQDRREALLRRAYELGFGTSDLRAFADEAGRIVHVAREGGGGMGLREIAREMERRAASDRGAYTPLTAASGLSPNGSTCASAATTLVAENVSPVAVEKGKLLDVPVLKLVGLDL